jgi:hypothetical protein
VQSIAVIRLVIVSARQLLPQPRRLHALGLSPEAVADWLRSKSLIGGEGWVQNRVKFFGAAARAVLIWSYWWGEPSVAAAWNAVPTERRREFLLYLHGRMHSNATVGMFA